MTVDKEDFLSAEEAADYLGVKRATFWRYIKKYPIPRYKKPVEGKRVFFRKSDLDSLKAPRPIE